MVPAGAGPGNRTPTTTGRPMGPGREPRAAIVLRHLPTTTRRGVSCGRPWGRDGAPHSPTTPNRQAHTLDRLAKPPSSPRTPMRGGIQGTGAATADYDPDQRNHVPPRPTTGAHKRRPYTVSAGAGPGIHTPTPRSPHHGYRVSPVRRGVWRDDAGMARLFS